MNYLKLTIAYLDFMEKYKDYRLEVEKLMFNNSIEPLTFIDKYKELDSKILSLLNYSFNIQNNEFYHDYRSVAGTIIQPQKAYLIDKLKSIIEKKLIIINYQIDFFSICDLIVSPSDELFNKRQKFSIRQKRELIMLKLEKLNKKFNHSISKIYIGNGLKKEINDEACDMGKHLYELGYLDFENAIGTDSFVNISLQGIEYAQDLNEQAYELYSVGEDLTDKEKNNLTEILRDLKEELKADLRKQFQEQNENLIIYFNALHEVTEESFELIRSKLPKKTIKQAIIGKIVDKAGDKGLDAVMGLFWDKFKAKLFEQPDFTELVSKADKFISGGN